MAQSFLLTGNISFAVLWPQAVSDHLAVVRLGVLLVFHHHGAYKAPKDGHDDRQHKVALGFVFHIISLQKAPVARGVSV